jgi:glycosyltransferase involved in cell wall biosynthesis
MPGEVYIIIPAYNESKSIVLVVSDLHKAGYQHVIVIDDGSHDDTASRAEAAGATILRHAFNLGQGAALQTGIDYARLAGAEFIVTFDADGQHSVSDIALLVDSLVKTRADFALGSRFLNGCSHVPPIRRAMLQLATVFTRVTTGLQLTDAHNGIRAMTAKGAAAIRLRQNRMAHASEFLAQIARSGLEYIEQPVTIRYTAYSIAKGQKTSDSFLILLDLFARTLYR